MLYTRKGDGGTTKTLRQGPGERISKGSAIAEALGTLDEINSLLGLVKVKAGQTKWAKVGERSVGDILAEVQHNLFTIQAELAGADKTIAGDKVKQVEAIIDGIEAALPPIKSFFVSGGTELAALCDVARTVARRAERRVVAAREGGAKLGDATMQYLNRLSSLLYALARLSNHLSGIKEEPPTYK